MWLKFLIGSVNDLMSLNLVRIIEVQLGFRQRQVTDCNSSPIIPASLRASKTPLPLSSQSVLCHMGVRVGLSKENFRCFFVLLKVVGRGVA